MRHFSFEMARPESPVIVWIRRVLIAVVCVHLVLSSWSLVRRLHQVFRIEVHASSTVLAPGSSIDCDVITSGEVKNRIRLGLLQGSRAEVLLEMRADVNGISAYVPRMFRYTPHVTLTPAVLSKFTPGPATLRLIVFGGQKLLHTPASRVRELAVVLSR